MESYQLNHCLLQWETLPFEYINHLTDHIEDFEFTHNMGKREIVHYGKQYAYSGIVHPENEIPYWLKPILEYVNQLANVEFNSVLVNHYPANVKVGIGMHSDDEVELGENPIVASLSLGASCVFKIRGRYDQCDMELDHGDLLIMGSGCQRYYKHGITPVINDQYRISLTFRKIY